ncbi:MAG TPA: phosphopantetheine-binding protein [Gammaproteobacteria bacterium]|nr:phosphopantetheine-binding protein [Gammaproteobacteria bacterium]
MQKNDYLEWLTHWFRKRMDIPTDAIYRDFFEERWLDSFKTIELITEIEKSFNLTLTDSVFSDPRFSTIVGLSEILLEITT